MNTSWTRAARYAAAAAGATLAVVAVLQGASSAQATGSTPAATPKATAVTSALSGVGYADRDQWGTWRGQPVRSNETWNDAKDSSGTITWGAMDALYTVNQYFSGGQWSGALSLAQPMYASNENVDGCASTQEITTWTNDLVAAWPRADAFVRLGWEFNGNWYSWSQKSGDASAFRSCWVRWYQTAKAIAPNLKFVWNPNSQSSDGSFDVRTFWPGAQYVDAAGPDFYAASDNGKLRDPDATDGTGAPLGIDAWVNWIAQQGVPLAVPEWGIRDQSYGSTDPAFIDQMRAAFQKAASSSTGLAYEDYFDGGEDFGCQYSIHDSGCGYDLHKAAADEYASLWSKPYQTSGTSPGTSLSRTGWTVSADSQETADANNPATAAIDGDANTFWHSDYTDSASDVLPHDITIDMHASHTVTGLSYLPRPQGAAGTGSENGRIGQYKIETSTDGTTWTTAATGTWPDDATAKTATFAGTTAEFVRLDALTEAGNRGPWSSAAELNLTGS